MRQHSYQRRLAGSFVLLGLVVGTLCLALAGAADGQGKQKPKKLTDAEITQLLPGKWLMQCTLKELLPKKLVDDPTFVDGTMTFVFHCNKDGTFEVLSTGVAGTVTRKNTFAGTWKVAEGVLEKTLTKVDAPDSPRDKVGDKGREILSIDTMTLTVQSIDKIGEMPMTFKRVKD